MLAGFVLAAALGGFFSTSDWSVVWPGSTGPRWVGIVKELGIKVVGLDLGTDKSFLCRIYIQVC